MKIPPSLIPIFYSGSWLPCCIEASFCAHSVAINCAGPLQDAGGVAFVFGGQSWHDFSAMQRQQKLTFGEMRQSGARSIEIHCADHRCSHSTTPLADGWPDGYAVV